MCWCGCVWAKSKSYLPVVPNGNSRFCLLANMTGATVPYFCSVLVLTKSVVV